VIQIATFDEWKASIIENIEKNDVVECLRCRGGGYEVCDDCDGNGRNDDGDACTRCDGDGEHTCVACKGEGFVLASSIPFGRIDSALSRRCYWRAIAIDLQALALARDLPAETLLAEVGLAPYLAIQHGDLVGVHCLNRAYITIQPPNEGDVRLMRIDVTYLRHVGESSGLSQPFESDSARSTIW
jgi:hypothetical protein